jgi:DNA-binding IclR family transcriptional regulator
VTDLVTPTDGGFLARQPSALDNGFAVLEAVAQHGAGVTARTLVETVPLSKATVYRILKHLVEQEYLVRTPDLTGFALGRRVLDLAGPPHSPGADDDPRDG